MKTHTGTVLRLSLALMASVSFVHAIERADVQSSAVAVPDLVLKAEAEKRAAAQAHFLTARMLEGEGRMREALGHYLAFLRGSTGDPELVAHIAEMALSYQGMESAVKLLEESVQAHADQPGPHVNFIQFALTHGDGENGLPVKAATVAGEAVKRFPQSAEVIESAVRLHLANAAAAADADRAAHREAAAKVLGEAARQPVADPAFWLGLGRIALEVWPLADGENRAAHLAKVNPFFEKGAQQAQAARDEEAELRAADFYLFSNQLDKAAALCEGVVKRSGTLESRKRLVRLYDAMERAEDSFRALEDLVKAHPLDVEHRRLIASHHVQRAQNAVRALRPDVAVQENRRAVEHLEAALQAGGGDLNDYLQLSNLLRFTDEAEKFERFTARAQQLFPGEPRVGYYRAESLRQTKQHAEAAKSYAESAKLAETRAPELLDDRFHFDWGTALERSGQFDAAARQFEKSIQLTPPEEPERAASVMNYLGYMWLEQGRQLDAADTLIRKANELRPDEPAFVDSLGWLLFKQGKFSEALTELLRSEKLLRGEQPEPEPGDAEIYDHIAQAYDKLGQRDKALEYWKRTLDVQPEIESIRERAERELGISKPKPAKPVPVEDEKPKTK